MERPLRPFPRLVVLSLSLSLACAEGPEHLRNVEEDDAPPQSEDGLPPLDEGKPSGPSGDPDDAPAAPTEDGGEEPSPPDSGTPLNATSAEDRLVTILVPHGAIPGSWSGSLDSTGTWQLGEVLQPLAAHGSRLVVFQNLDLGNDPSWSNPYGGHANTVPSDCGGAAVLLTANIRQNEGCHDTYEIDATEALGKSLDVVLGERSALPFPSLALSAGRAVTLKYRYRLTWTGAAQDLPALDNPLLAHDQLFAGYEHPAGFSLPPPQRPTYDAADLSSSNGLVRTLDAQLDVAFQALAYDRSRTVSVALLDGILGSYGFPWLGSPIPQSYGYIVHNPTTTNVAKYALAQQWMMSRIAAFLDKLEATPTSDGQTLLDHTVVLIATDTGSPPQAHRFTSVPFVLVGNASAKLSTPQAIDLGHRTHADVLLSVGRAFLPELATFGAAGLNAQPVPGLLR